MGDQFSRQYFERLAPKALETGVVAVNTTAASISLLLLGPQSQSSANAAITPQANVNSAGPGLLNRRVEFFAETANIGVLFGPTQASVSNNLAPNIGNTGTTNSNGTCVLIAAGKAEEYIIHSDTIWLGYVGSTNGNLRIAVISRGT